MKVAERCADAIRRVGGEAYVLHGETRVPFVASIQPRLVGGEPDTALSGIGSARYYTLYTSTGVAEDTLKYGDTVEFYKRRFNVRRIETVYFSGEPAYHWAVLRLESGEA